MHASSLGCNILFVAKLQVVRSLGELIDFGLVKETTFVGRVTVRRDESAIARSSFN